MHLFEIIDIAFPTFFCCTTVKRTKFATLNFVIFGFQKQCTLPFTNILQAKHQQHPLAQVFSDALTTAKANPFVSGYISSGLLGHIITNISYR